MLRNLTSQIFQPFQMHRSQFLDLQRYPGIGKSSLFLQNLTSQQSQLFQKHGSWFFDLWNFPRAKKSSLKLLEKLRFLWGQVLKYGWQLGHLKDQKIDTRPPRKARKIIFSSFYAIFKRKSCRRDFLLRLQSRK